jgi:hypothetical protein
MTPDKQGWVVRDYYYPFTVQGFFSKYHEALTAAAAPDANGTYYLRAVSAATLVYGGPK